MSTGSRDSDLEPVSTSIDLDPGLTSNSASDQISNQNDDLNKLRQKLRQPSILEILSKDKTSKSSSTRTILNEVRLRSEAMSKVVSRLISEANIPTSSDERSDNGSMRTILRHTSKDNQVGSN